ERLSISAIRPHSTAQSPDLNPMELVNLQVLHNNLWELSQQCWDELSEQYLSLIGFHTVCSRGEI
uniref:Uncharacterized protein n=1 Tax=Seriola lalandi dorsalis TaxID=1841481 RepID=A0A3B4WDV5_SERLL